MGALEEEDDDIYEVEKRHDYDRSVTDDTATSEAQFGWTGPHSIGDRWTMECFVKASRSRKPAKVSVCPSVCLSVENFSVWHYTNVSSSLVIREVF